MIPATGADNHQLKLIIDSIGRDSVPRLGPFVHEVYIVTSCRSTQPLAEGNQLHLGDACSTGSHVNLPTGTDPFVHSSEPQAESKTKWNASLDIPRNGIRHPGPSRWLAESWTPQKWILSQPGSPHPQHCGERNHHAKINVYNIVCLHQKSFTVTLISDITQFRFSLTRAWNLPQYLLGLSNIKFTF